MPTVVITPPASIVDVDTAKRHLRVDSADDDDLIELLIASATAHLDGPGGWLGRSLGLQTLEWSRAGYWGLSRCAHRLPFPPIVSVSWVKYLDAEGAETTFTDEGYELNRDGTLAPVYLGYWPTGRSTSEAFRVRYVAGYATVPADIKTAILNMVSFMYDNREAGPSVALKGVMADLAQYRTYDWS